MGIMRDEIKKLHKTLSEPMLDAIRGSYDGCFNVLEGGERTLAALRRRGVLHEDGRLTALGVEVLNWELGYGYFQTTEWAECDAYDMQSARELVERTARNANPHPSAKTLAYQVLDHIDADPQSWEQGVWLDNCGTVACFAGWASLLSGDTPESGPGGGVDTPAGPRYVSERARELLDVSEFLAGELFAASNTRADLGWLVTMIYGPRETPEYVA
jgi:hypothetical protein